MLYKILSFITIILVFPTFAMCFPISTGISGLIIDKDTGLPIIDAVLVRSWDKVTAGFEGPHHELLTFDETFTHEKGEFSFSPKFLPHIEIPGLSWIEENRLIVFKPGYRFLASDQKTSTIEMQKVSATYYLRYEEVSRARDNYEIDFDKPKLFKEMVELDERFVRSLPKFLLGVFAIGPENDIDFDKEGNIYTAGDQYIKKLSRDGDLLGLSQVTSDHKPIDIEIDEEGDIYAFMRNQPLKINLSEKGIKEARAIYPAEFTAVPYIIPLFYKKKKKADFPSDVDLKVTIVNDKGLKIFLIAPQGNFFKSYDLDSNLLCKYDGVKFKDIASDSNGYILVSHSYGPVSNGAGYSYQSGIMKFDQNCNKISDTNINADGKEVRSIATTADEGIIVANSNSFYIFDKKFNLLYKENLNDKDLGEIDIKRIKTDPQKNNLYLIDSKYNRILKYNLRNKEWYKKSNASLTNQTNLTEKVVRRSWPPKPISGEYSPKIKVAPQSERKNKIQKELLEVGAISIEPVIAALRDKDYIRQTAATWVLGEIGDRKAVTHLISLLNEKDSGVRRMCIEALGKIKDDRAVNPLLEIAKNKNRDYYERKEAVWALGEIGNNTTIGSLIELLKQDKNSFVHDSTNEFKIEIITTLGKIKDPAAVEQLNHLLTDAYSPICNKAVLALGEIGDRRAIEPLVTILNDKSKDQGIRWNAAVALSKIGKPSVKSLITALQNNVDYIGRGYAAYVLGEIKDPSSVKPLIKAMEDTEYVRTYAAVALGKIRDVRAIESLIKALSDKDYNVQNSASHSLENIGRPSVEPLISALHERNIQVRINAIEIIVNIGAPSVQPLIASLNDDNLIVRMIAKWILENIGKTAIEDLIEALKDKNSEIRWNMAEILGNIGDTRALDALISRLGGNDSIVRWKTAEALGKMKDRKAIDPLLTALKDNNPMVRKSASWALGNLGDIKAVKSP